MSTRRTGERIAGLVYGTIVVMGVIAAPSDDSDTARIAALVVATSVVFWLAHVYAHSLELSIVRRERLTAQWIKDVAVHQAPILSAAVLPTGALLLGAFDLVGDRRAVLLAMAAGTAALAGQSLAYARIEKLSLLGTATLVMASLLLGLALVGLKVFVSH
jgi:uncharacterized membrane protein YvlD (DUF360 family)